MSVEPRGFYGDQYKWKPVPLADHYIDVADMCPKSDTEDCTDAIQAACAIADGRELVFKKRRYFCEDRPTSSPLFRLPNNSSGKMRFAGGAYLDCSGWPLDVDPATVTGRRIMQVSGTQSVAYPVIEDAWRGQGYIRSPDLAAALLAMPRKGRDAWVIIESSEPFTMQDSSSNKSENIIVAYVGTGADADKIFFPGWLRDTYYVGPGTTNAYIITPCSWDFENFMLLGPGRFIDNLPGERGLVITLGRGCNVENAYIEQCDFVAISYAGVLGGIISGCDLRGDQTGGMTNFNVSFGIGLQDGCQGIAVVNTNCYGMSQQYMLTAGGTPGITRDILHHGCNAYGAYSGAFAQHSAHEDIFYVACKVVACDSAFDIRCRNTTIQGCQILELPEGPLQTSRAALVLRGTGMENLLVEGCFFKNIFRIVRFLSGGGYEGRPHNLVFRNNRIERPVNNGFNVDWPYDNMGLHGLLLDGNVVTDVRGAVIPAEIAGPWQDPIIINTKATGGIGTNRPVYLTSSHTCLGHGPRNPQVSGTRWGPGFIEPAWGNRMPVSLSNVAESQQFATGGSNPLLINGSAGRGVAKLSTPAAVYVTSIGGADLSAVELTIGGYIQLASGFDEGYNGYTKMGPGPDQTITFEDYTGNPAVFREVYFLSHAGGFTGQIKVGTLADDDAICLAQGGGSSREFIINGVAVHKRAVFGGPQQIHVTFTGDESGRYFWLYGRNEGNNLISEKIYGGPAGVVLSRNLYRQVERFTTSSPTASTVRVGTATDNDCIVQAQTISAEATLNGILVADRHTVFDVGRRLVYTANAADNSGVFVTTDGTDDNGNSVSETHAFGVGAPGVPGSVVGSVFFRTVARSIISGPTNGYVQIGTTAITYADFHDNHRMGSAGVRQVYPGDPAITLSMDEKVVFFDTTLGPITANLGPVAGGLSFKEYTLKNVGAGGNAVTFVPLEGETISHATLAAGAVMRIKSDGANRWERLTAA